MTDYLLGHEASELERLTTQHALWRATLLDGIGIQPHHRVLEIGCGGGDLLADLAALTPHARGLERDPDAAMQAARRAGVEVQTGDLFDAELPRNQDVIVARWVLSFVSELDKAIARLATFLAPGGRLVVQDYNHEGLSLFPPSPAFDTVIAAFRTAYARTGGDLWVAGHLPAAMARAGLEVERIEPHVKAGGPDSGVWQWVERFLLSHVDTLVEANDLSEADRTAFLADWTTARETAGAVLFSPLIVTTVARLPDRRG